MIVLVVMANLLQFILEFSSKQGIVKKVFYFFIFLFIYFFCISHVI